MLCRSFGVISVLCLGTFERGVYLNKSMISDTSAREPETRAPSVVVARAATSFVSDVTNMSKTRDPASHQSSLTR